MFLLLSTTSHGRDSLMKLLIRAPSIPNFGCQKVCIWFLGKLKVLFVGNISFKIWEVPHCYIFSKADLAGLQQLWHCSCYHSSWEMYKSTGITTGASFHFGGSEPFWRVNMAGTKTIKHHFIVLFSFSRPPSKAFSWKPLQCDMETCRQPPAEPCRAPELL